MLQLPGILPQEPFPQGCWANRSWDILGPRSQWLSQLLAVTQGKDRSIPRRQQLLLDIHQCAWESIPLPHWAQVMKGWQEGFASEECLRRGQDDQKRRRHKFIDTEKEEAKHCPAHKSQPLKP